MKKFIKYRLYFAVSLAPSIVQAQDIHFSQFYENATMRNPALTGIFSGDYKAGVNYRSQWSSVAIPFITYLGSAETRIAVGRETGDFLSVGLTATYDKAGSISFNSFSGYLSLNYNKAMGDSRNSYLSVGMAGGYIQRSVEASKMTFANQFVNNSYSANNASRENLSNGTLTHYDVAAGISFNSSLGAAGKTNYYIGAAAYHINKPKETFYGDGFSRLSARWSANAGLHSALGNDLRLAVHANYQLQQPYREVIAGALLGWVGKDMRDQRFLSVYAGCFYRYDDAVIPTLKLEYKRWELTASYDIGVSRKRSMMNRAGGMELSLFCRGLFPRRMDYRDPLKCPRFEGMAF